MVSRVGSGETGRCCSKSTDKQLQDEYAVRGKECHILLVTNGIMIMDMYVAANIASKYIKQVTTID